MRNRINNIKNKTWKIFAINPYAYPAHPRIIWGGTILGALGGYVFGMIATIWSDTDEGLSSSEKRALKVEKIDNLAATFNCNVTKVVSRRSHDVDDGQLPSSLSDVRFKCVNMTLSERVLQMATDEFKKIENENDEGMQILKTLGKGFVYAVGGFFIGGATGYYVANVLVNIKLEFFGEGITPVDVRNRKEEKNLSAITKRFKLNDKEQARALFQHPELHIWFLQGIQKVQDGTMPLDIFIHISSYIGELSDKNTYFLFRNYRKIMPLRLFATSHIFFATSHIHDAKKLLDGRAVESQLKSKLDNFEKQKQETQKRFEKRMSLYTDENSDTRTKQKQTRNKHSTKAKRRGWK